MKSKTSFFNKTMYLKNITLYSPIWMLYLLFLCAMVPGRLWKNLRVMSQWSVTRSDYYNSFYSTLDDILGIGYLLFGALLLAGFSAMALYHYLYVAKNANMIHSLPVTRLELYVTNIASGLTFAIVPQVIATVLAELVCIRYGQHCEGELFMWMLYGIGIHIIFQAIATLCAQLTGLLIAVPMFFALSNVLVSGFALLFQVILTSFAYGVDFDNNEILSIGLVEWMTPIAKIAGQVGLTYRTNESGTIIPGLEAYGPKVLIGYLVVAVVLYWVGWIAYKKRSLECAGDLVAFRFLKPVFRWGVGFTCGYVSALILEAILENTGDQWSFARFLVLDIVLSVLFYFIAEMLLQKKFKIFNKNCVKPLIAFGVFMVVSYGSFAAAGSHLENKIPDADKVERVYAYMDYKMELTGEEIPEIIEIQKLILDNKKALEKELSSRVAGYISISYHMKDGSIIDRRYRYHLPSADEKYEFVNRLMALQKKPEHMAMDMLCYNYEEQLTPTKVQFEHIPGYNEADEDNEIAVEVESGNDESDGENETVFGYQLPRGYNDPKIAAKIYEALLKDIKEGNVHNLYLGEYEEDIWDEADYERMLLYMDFAVKDIKHYQSIEMRERDMIYSRGDGNYDWSDSNLNDIQETPDLDGTNIQKEFMITPRCVNVLQVLAELDGQQ